VKRKFVDHTMYSTTSVLRTIELILGMPPMSQYDASAISMWRCFQSSPDRTVTLPSPCNGISMKKIQLKMHGQRKSEKFDFTKEDRIPDREFTEVIWKAVKGEHAIVPAPKRAAFVKQNGKKDDDD